jgi:NAD(P)-dependent dehydrogenase (short-subunit alcohol dehydrogenase family)
MLPVKRVGRPDEVAAAAVFLCTEPAAFITGIAMPVDGGMAAG